MTYLLVECANCGPVRLPPEDITQVFDRDGGWYQFNHCQHDAQRRPTTPRHRVILAAAGCPEFDLRESNWDQALTELTS